MNQDEQQLADLFGELKQRDEGLAHPFEQDAAAADLLRGCDDRINYGRLFIAASLLVVVALTVGFLARQTRSQSPLAVHIERLNAVTVDRSMASLDADRAISFASWQSPTASLLREADDWGLVPADSSDEPALPRPQTQPLTGNPT